VGDALYQDARILLLGVLHSARYRQGLENCPTRSEVHGMSNEELAKAILDSLQEASPSAFVQDVDDYKFVIDGHFDLMVVAEILHQRLNKDPL
jgi:hypothetical protein